MNEKRSIGVEERGLSFSLKTKSLSTFIDEENSRERRVEVTIQNT